MLRDRPPEEEDLARPSVPSRGEDVHRPAPPLNCAFRCFGVIGGHDEDTGAKHRGVRSPPGCPSPFAVVGQLAPDGAVELVQLDLDLDVDD